MCANGRLSNILTDTLINCIKRILHLTRIFCLLQPSKKGDVPTHLVEEDRNADNTGLEERSEIALPKKALSKWDRTKYFVVSSPGKFANSVKSMTKVKHVHLFVINHYLSVHS